MVLDHIANRAGFLIKLAAALDAERLRHRDLHAVNIVAIPDGLQKAVGEAEDQQVLDRFLAQVVVDAEDIFFRKSLVQRVIQLARRDQIAPERLLQDHASTVRATGFRQALHHHRKHAGRDREIVRGTLGIAQLGAQRLVGLVVLVIAVEVAEQFAQFAESFLVHASAVLDQAVACAFAQLLDGPA